MVRWWRRGLTALLAMTLAAPLSAAPLRFCYEDAPFAPWTMPNGTGLNIDLLKRVEKQLGEQFVFVARPWKRCLEETRAGLIDGVIGTADGPDRRAIGVFPTDAQGQLQTEQALFQDRANVFLLAGSLATWNGLELHNPREIVIAQRGYRVADLLRERGSKVLDNVKVAEEAFRAMLAGVADVAVLQGSDAQLLAHHDPRFADKILEARQPFVVFHFYLMIGKKSFEADPKRIQAIWQGIAQVRQSVDYRKVEAAELLKVRPD